MLINKFTTGVMIGGILGAAGIMMMESDRKTRKRIRKTGMKMMTKAGDFIEDMMDM